MDQVLSLVSLAYHRTIWNTNVRFECWKFNTGASLAPTILRNRLFSSRNFGTRGSSWITLILGNQKYRVTLTCQIIVQQILLFFWEKNTYTNLLGPTRLIISQIFPTKVDFHLHKWEKNPSYTALLRPTRLLISEKSATYTMKWSYTTIWQVRVV